MTLPLAAVTFFWTFDAFIINLFSVFFLKIFSIHLAVWSVNGIENLYLLAKLEYVSDTDLDCYLLFRFLDLI